MRISEAFDQDQQTIGLFKRREVFALKIFDEGNLDDPTVIDVHLKGTFATSRHAVGYWRARAKSGEPVSGRIINTTSISGLYGNPGQTNYGAAKAAMFRPN